MLREDRRNGLVDLAKFVMSIGVMLGHYSYIFNQEFSSVKITKLPLIIAHGSLAEFVCVFFVISGFYAYHSFESLHQTGPSGIGPFLKKKVNRLFPLMLISVAYFCFVDIVYLLVKGHFWAGRQITFQNIILTSLGIGTWVCVDKNLNGPVWYVSVLLLCLVILCVISALNIGKEYKYLLFTLMMILGLITVLTPGITVPLLKGKIGRGYFAFFTGVLIAAVFEKWPQITRLRNIVIVLAVFAVLCVIGRKTGQDLIGTPMITVAFCFAPAIVALGQQDCIKLIFNNSMFSWLGSISYGIFLLHIPTYLMVSLLFGESITYNRWLVIGLITIAVVGQSAIFTRLTKKAALIK